MTDMPSKCTYVNKVLLPMLEIYVRSGTKKKGLDLDLPWQRSVL